MPGYSAVYVIPIPIETVTKAIKHEFMADTLDDKHGP
jgi:hypothetical protein